MRIALLLITACFFSLIVNAQTSINLGTTTVHATPIFTTTYLPWELKYGPGDSLWMTTRPGRVFRIHPVNGGSTELLNHSANVWQSGESGMLGMAFHPQFATTPYVFIVYTYTSGGLNRERLSRFTYGGNSLSGEVILIDGGTINASSIHNGSRLVVTDSTILMSTGDAANTSLAQNMSSMNGKILRINLDGTIPADNPVPGSRIYSWGHRNPQGLFLHPNNKVYETEHGPGNNDEFQIIESNRNYGWPNVEGYCDNDINFAENTYCINNNIKAPLAAWNPSPGGTWAPSDLTWYRHPAIPEFDSSFLVTFLKATKVRRVKLNTAGDAVTGQADFFINTWGRLRDITAAPDGSIYLATNTAPYRIIRIHNPTYAPVPVTVTNYTSTCISAKPVIKWTTQSESANKHFLVYHSQDSQTFQLIATIPTSAAGGNSNMPITYTFTDNAAGSRSYYKVVSEDLNGRLHQLGIVSASCSAGIDFILKPNPSRGWAKLEWTGYTGKLLIKVFGSTGQLMYQTNSTGAVDLPVNRWQSGVYIITAMDAQNNVLFTEKLEVK